MQYLPCVWVEPVVKSRSAQSPRSGEKDGERATGNEPTTAAMTRTPCGPRHIVLEQSQYLFPTKYAIHEQTWILVDSLLT